MVLIRGSIVVDETSLCIYYYKCIVYVINARKLISIKNTPKLRQDSYMFSLMKNKYKSNFSSELSSGYTCVIFNTNSL